jgi:nicotinate-nucleotide adenylyltransferase
MRLGLMGGTFDPIHFGHLFIAEEARARCGLDEVLFFPNNQPAHRQGKDAHADPETRMCFVEVAIAGNPYFRASRIEMDRSGPSYAFDTLRLLKAQIDAELFYIVGADSMGEVLTWHRGAELFEYCRFIAASRPGYDLEAARKNLSPAQRERVIFLEVPGLYIASSELRRRARENLPLRYLTPDAVIAEIEKHKLYRNDN